MAGAALARHLTILTRAPSAGGKSRLFTALGRAPDPALLEALLLDTLDGTTLPGVRRIVAVTPASKCAEVRALVARAKGALEIAAQSEGDLGARMRAAMQGMFDAGARAAAVVGSDLPAITPALVAAAFARLDEDPDALVLGPATDGGYYLIAAGRPPEVFDGIEWGSDRVLSATAAAAARAGFHVCLLDDLRDVDTPDDLRCVARSPGARRTAAWLRTRGSA